MAPPPGRRSHPPVTRRLLLAAFVVLALPGQASARSCAKTAKVVEGEVARVDMMTGQPLPGAVTTLKRARRHVYSIAGGATIAFQGVTYEFSGEAMLSLGCYGESAKAGAIFPSVTFAGDGVEVTSKAGKPGAVANQAGFAHAHARAAMTFTASASSPHQLTVKKPADAPGKLQVTPYAGPKKGTCRYVVRSASLDAEADSARYDGRSA